MIIDSHAHLSGPDFEESAKALLKLMDAAGVDKSAIFACPLSANPLSNEDAVRIAKKFPERFFAVGTVSPLKPKTSPRELGKLFAKGDIRGLKFYTGYEHFYPNDIKLLRPYIECAQSAGYPVIFHMGDTIRGEVQAKLKFAHPLVIDELAVEYPELKIIIAHLGNPWLVDAAAVLYKNENVYADMSGLAYGKTNKEERKDLKSLMARMESYLEGLDKLLFGTDWPVSEHASCVELASALPASKEVKENIFSGNARKLFQLE